VVRYGRRDEEVRKKLSRKIHLVVYSVVEQCPVSDAHVPHCHGGHLERGRSQEYVLLNRCLTVRLFLWDEDLWHCCR
jgi:hypothetical protein